MSKKKKILFLAPYPKGEAPSQRFRFEQYLDFLKDHGFEYEFQSFFSLSIWKILYKKGKFLKKLWGVFAGYSRRFAILFKLGQVDYVFIHREAAPYGPPFIEYIISKWFKKKIIFDFDDAIWLPNYSHSNRLFANLKKYHKVKDIIRYSHKISAGNEYLIQYAKDCGNANVVYNPTTVDMDHWHRETKVFNTSSPTVIGWTGTHSTIRYLKPIVKMIKSLEEEGYNLELIIIADQNPDFDINGFRFVPWSKEKEVQDLLKMDIGIMPLKDDEWARGKCGFKALQYMSLGIPAMVSPVGVNANIVDHTVNGFICNEEEEWKKQILNIVSNKHQLVALGKNAKDKIRHYYSVESNKQNFISLFKD